MIEICTIITAVYYEIQGFIKPGYTTKISENFVKKSKEFKNTAVPTDEQKSEFKELSSWATWYLIFSILYIVFSIDWLFDSDPQIVKCGTGMIVLSIISAVVNKSDYKDTEIHNTWRRIDSFLSLFILIVIFNKRVFLGL